MMFLDCPAYMDLGGAVRCGLPLIGEQDGGLAARGAQDRQHHCAASAADCSPSRLQSSSTSGRPPATRNWFHETAMTIR